MFLWMTNNINQLQMRLAQAESRHELGVKASRIQALQVQPLTTTPLHEENAHCRLDQLLKIMRNAPMLTAGNNESWRMFEFSFNTWRNMSKLDAYAD